MTNVAALRIIQTLRVEVTLKPEGGIGEWALYFDAPSDVNLDFLRPDILPPV